ncbi:MAG: polyprenyl synthetase family protein [Bacteroidota bacterium]
MQSVERLQRTFIQSLEASMGEPEWSRQPDRLYAPQRYILAMGGKRLRPVLALMGAEAVGAKAEVALPAAHAVERFHNFSLIHDDIMDAAPLRRGHATVHERWGVNTAILSGDALFALAFKALEAAPKSALPELYRVFTQTALEVCEGQQWDMDFEHEDRVEEGAYLRMIQYKTSVLLGCALQMGVLSGGGSAEVAQALYSFGLELGTSFQIHDDLLDAFGDPAKTGKQAGGDLIQGKKTMLWIELGRRSPEHLNEAMALSGAERVDVLTEALETTGVRAYVESRRKEHFDRALVALGRAGDLGAATPDLRELAEWLFSRES